MRPPMAGFLRDRESKCCAAPWYVLARRQNPAGRLKGSPRPEQLNVHLYFAKPARVAHLQYDPGQYRIDLLFGHRGADHHHRCHFVPLVARLTSSAKDGRTKAPFVGNGGRYLEISSTDGGRRSFER
jgi:hypothetical protein